MQCTYRVPGPPPVPSLSSLQFFVIGHDCGHRSFSENKLLEDIVGTLAFMPLIYPFEPWRIKHNQHHAQTNK
jgi:omega-6 fatty acid desaturase (delta-12 desaturase)